jgi:hypothetical protein
MVRCSGGDPRGGAVLVDFSKKILMVKFLEENMAKRRNCGKEVVLLVALCVKF